MIKTLSSGFCAMTLWALSVSPSAQADPFLSPFESRVVEEINRVRTQPSAYAEHLERLRVYYRGQEVHRPGEAILITQEGLPALEEAIDFLRTADPVAALTASRGLSKSAADHARDQAESGLLGHLGTDGSQPWERMNRNGDWAGTAAENISYGHNDARGVVIQLLVDDGVPDRGHRLNIFNPDYRFIGVACGPHPAFRMMCVMDFAADYKEQ
jgi:uncharacterized protein YkwD